ncbi:MAG: hypothetical protein WKH64_05905 [Chloroflexia bacterium]
MGVREVASFRPSAAPFERSALNSTPNNGGSTRADPVTPAASGLETGVVGPGAATHHKTGLEHRAVSGTTATDAAERRPSVARASLGRNGVREAFELGGAASTSCSSRPGARVRTRVRR